MTAADMELYQKIGQRIREFRLSQGLSQGELAAKANLSLTQIGNIERGNAKMQVASFCRIAEALGISADELLRLNVPTVNQLYQHELQGLLSDFTPEQLESIKKIVLEIKKSLKQKATEYDD